MKRFTFLLAAVMAATTLFGQNTGSWTNGGLTEGPVRQAVRYGGQMLTLSDDGTNEHLKYTNVGLMGSSYSAITTLPSETIQFLQGAQDGTWTSWWAEGNTIKQIQNGSVTTIAESQVDIINNVVRLDNGTYIWVGSDNMLYMPDELGTGGVQIGTYIILPNTKIIAIGNILYFEMNVQPAFGWASDQWCSLDFTDDVNAPVFSNLTGFSTNPSYSTNNAVNTTMDIGGTPIIFAADELAGYNRIIVHGGDYNAETLKVGGMYACKSSVENIAAYGTKMYLGAEVTEGVSKLYSVVPAPLANATVFVEINGTDVSDEIESVTVSGDYLFFFATDATLGKGLYSVDLTAGTPSATRLGEAANGMNLTAISRTGTINYYAVYSVGTAGSEQVFVTDGMNIYEVILDDTYTAQSGIRAIYGHGRVVYIMHSEGTLNEVSELYSWPMDVVTSLESATEANVSVGPNPVSDILRIAGETVTNVEVYNLAGVIVLSETGSNITAVNMGRLGSGLYIVNVTTVDGATRTVKITKR
ncbi:T9SS type A sorting domain-containing protein [Carboxylicivirga sp. RSCT41]|uniref:T9SS type A sorting domain-containing protein n=1 Tax=Carboxylicivirga agarovorans TaxID=3417570 RepID=UPI003D34D66C